MTRARNTADTQTASGGPVSPGIAGKNAIINGGFDIWQRGTTNVTTASVYTADRWNKGAQTSCGVSRQVTGDTTNLPNIQYCARMQRTAASTNINVNDIGYSLETADSIRFAGQTVTLSFYARAGANFSATSNILTCGIYSGTGTDQNLMTTGFTGTLITVSGNKTLTTNWQRFTITGTVSSSATQLGLYFNATPTGTAGAADYYEITGVQLELGSSATPFSRAGGSIQGELAACQRYYYRLNGTAAENLVSTSGISWSTTRAQIAIQNPVQMRAIPTVLEYSGLNLSDFYAYNLAVSSLIFVTALTNTSYTVVDPTYAASATIARSAWLRTSTSAGYLGVGAEL